MDPSVCGGSPGAEEGRLSGDTGFLLSVVATKEPGDASERAEAGSVSGNMGWLKGGIAGWLLLSEGSFAETVALKVFEVGLVNSARMTPPDTSGFSPSGKTLEATSNTGQVSGSGTAARMGVFGLVFPARWESTSSNGEACDNWFAAVWGARCAGGALLVPVFFDESLSDADGASLE